MNGQQLNTGLSKDLLNHGYGGYGGGGGGGASDNTKHNLSSHGAMGPI